LTINSGNFTTRIQSKYLTAAFDIARSSSFVSIDVSYDDRGLRAEVRSAHDAEQNSNVKHNVCAMT
jgi:hypothetical protein